MKLDLDAITEQLTTSVEISYNLAMDSFNKRPRRGTLVSTTQTQKESENYESKKGEEDEPEVGDQPQQPRNV